MLYIIYNILEPEDETESTTHTYGEENSKKENNITSGHSENWSTKIDEEDIKDFIKNSDTPSEDSTVSSNEIKSEKRTDYISWDTYFMEVAKITAQRSKDPVTQVGAVIVNNNRIISTGYNGFPNGISDDIYPWGKDDKNILNDKRTFVVHAELNAILNSNNFEKLQGSTLYVTNFPCNECAKAIIQAGIKKIVYLDDSDVYKHDECIASVAMFGATGIDLVFYGDIVNKK